MIGFIGAVLRNVRRRPTATSPARAITARTMLDGCQGGGSCGGRVGALVVLACPEDEEKVGRVDQVVTAKVAFEPRGGAKFRVVVLASL